MGESHGVHAAAWDQSKDKQRGVQDFFFTSSHPAESISPDRDSQGHMSPLPRTQSLNLIDDPPRVHTTDSHETNSVRVHSIQCIDDVRRTLNQDRSASNMGPSDLLGLPGSWSVCLLTKVFSLRIPKYYGGLREESGLDAGRTQVRTRALAYLPPRSSGIQSWWSSDLTRPEDSPLASAQKLSAPQWRVVTLIPDGSLADLAALNQIFFLLLLLLFFAPWRSGSETDQR